ncbi:hypothetical protein V1517DRAFT_325423 [Lipomyces orientalis]|uniref:Uncharacterized protein n=1 Tax=Lipomyces orientalis TaxID=1233043 RepID=A0ACC3TKR8_9ASCO
MSRMPCILRADPRPSSSKSNGTRVSFEPCQARSLVTISNCLRTTATSASLPPCVPTHALSWPVAQKCADSEDVVQRFHELAFKLGGVEYGKPGIREDYSAVYVFDPEANNVDLVKWPSERSSSVVVIVME